MPSVLVTGASRGIGLHTARLLASRGWTVYAGVRQERDAGELAQAGITAVTLDITDSAALASLPERLGGHLDAVVNNAGIVVSGPVEALALEELRRQLEVNVTAQVAVTQAVLPLLRPARGRIVFTSSISGRVSTPLLGAYAASKFALEGLADALRVELRPWGIRVSLVEPGSIDTDIWRGALETADQVEAAMSAEHRQLYARQIKAIRRLAARVQRQAAPPDTVAAAVHQALTARRPRARYLVGTDARAQLAMSRLLPRPAWDAALALISGSR